MGGDTERETEEGRDAKRDGAEKKRGRGGETETKKKEWEETERGEKQRDAETDTEGGRVRDRERQRTSYIPSFLDLRFTSSPPHQGFLSTANWSPPPATVRCPLPWHPRRRDQNVETDLEGKPRPQIPAAFNP